MSASNGSHAAAQERGTSKGTFKERDALIRDMLADDGLGHAAAIVGVAIAMAGSRSLSTHEIAEAAGVAVRSVFNAILQLEARGWLIVRRAGPPHINGYQLVRREVRP
jgi:hypothetical protein